MTLAPSTTMLTLATRHSVEVVAESSERLVLSSVMRAVHGFFRHKPSEHLAAIVGCDVETARRYFAGKRAPNGEAMIAMLRHPVGVAIVEAAVRELPALDQRDFWEEMSWAAARAIRELRKIKTELPGT